MPDAASAADPYAERHHPLGRCIALELISGPASQRGELAGAASAVLVHATSC
jgi:hypothetical protein